MTTHASIDRGVSPHLSMLLSSEGTPTVPRISTAQMLSDPENRELLDLLTQPPENAQQFRSKSVAVIATDGVEEIELTANLKYFRERGAKVDLIALKKPNFPAMLGVQIPEIRATHILTVRYMDLGSWIRFDKEIDDARPADYDVVIIPGGAWNPDALRADAKVLAFVQEMDRSGKTVASICHGPWVLADAGLLKGKRATAWWAIKQDLTKAGATWVDEPLVVDGNVITSRAPIDLAPFLKAISQRLAPAR